MSNQSNWIYCQYIYLYTSKCKHLNFPQTLIIHMNEPTRCSSLHYQTQRNIKPFNFQLTTNSSQLVLLQKNRPKILLSTFSECSSESGFLISRQRRSNMLRSNSVTRRKLPDFWPGPIADNSPLVPNIYLACSP